MDWIKQHWWVVVVVVVVVLAALVLLLRPRQRVTLTDSAPIRPHMAAKRPAEGRGLVGEAATATTNVTGDILKAPVRARLDGSGKPGDDLSS